MNNNNNHNYFLFPILHYFIIIITGGDGPSLALLNYMAIYDFEAPATWANYRPLTSK